MTSRKKFERILRHPLSWLGGAVASVVGVGLSVGMDPVTAVSVALSVFSAQAMNLFTGSTIIGFTLQGFIPWDGLVTAVRIVAVVSGVAVAMKIADGAWDEFKRRMR